MGVKNHASVATTGQPKHRHSLRNGFNGLSACSPRRDRALLSPSPRGLLTHETWHLPLGHQAHTPLPSASTPSSRASPRPPHSAPRVVTIAIRPSCRGGMGAMNHMIPNNGRRIIFDKAENSLDRRANHSCEWNEKPRWGPDQFCQNQVVCPQTRWHDEATSALLGWRRSQRVGAMAAYFILDTKVRHPAGYAGYVKACSPSVQHHGPCGRPV